MRNHESEIDNFFILLMILLGFDSGINFHGKIQNRPKNRNRNGKGIGYDTALLCIKGAIWQSVQFPSETGSCGDEPSAAEGGALPGVHRQDQPRVDLLAHARGAGSAAGQTAPACEYVLKFWRGFKK